MEIYRTIFCSLLPPGTKKMEHKGHSWHEKCFICSGCQQPIGTESFVKKDSNKYCLSCYEKLFALHCVHCKKVKKRHTLSLLTNRVYEMYPKFFENATGFIFLFCLKELKSVHYHFRVCLVKLN